MMVPKVRILHGSYANLCELENEVNQWMRGLTSPDDIIRTHIINVGDEVIVSIFYHADTMSTQRSNY